MMSIALCCDCDNDKEREIASFQLDNLVHSQRQPCAVSISCTALKTSERDDDFRVKIVLVLDKNAAF